MILLHPNDEKLLAIVSIPLPDYPVATDSNGWDEALGEYHEEYNGRMPLNSDEEYLLEDGTKIVIYRRSYDGSVFSTNIYPKEGKTIYYIQNPSTS